MNCVTRKPVFVIVGAIMSGTSRLHHYLRRNSDLPFVVLRDRAWVG